MEFPDLSQAAEEAVSSAHKNWALEGPDDILEVVVAVNTVADNAIHKLRDKLISEGANAETILAYEQAVEARAALEVLTCPNEELERHPGSPQQALFDHVAGPEDEGMGMPAIIRHLAIGLPE